MKRFIVALLFVALSFGPAFGAAPKMFSWAPAASAGITVITSVKSASATASGTTCTLAVDCTGGDCLYVFCYVGGASTVATATATYNSVSMTSVTQTGLPGAFITDCFRLVAPATGSHNAVVTITGTTIAGAAIIAVVLHGVNQTTPEGSASVNANTGTSNTATVSSSTSGLVLGMVYVDTAPTVTSAGGQTTLQTFTVVSSDLIRVDTIPGAASVAPSWSWTGSQFTDCIVVPVQQ